MGCFMIMPPAAPAAQEHRTPREVIFIIDTSGSMHGQSIEQAKAALQLAVARLTRDDTFNIIQFNSTMDVLFADAVPADPIHIAKATQYASRLVAQGGTQMQPALQRALDGRGQHARLRQVIFLTDGQVGNEDALFKIITSPGRQSAVHPASASVRRRTVTSCGRRRNSAAAPSTDIGNTTEVQHKMEVLLPEGRSRR